MIKSDLLSDFLDSDLGSYYRAQASEEELANSIGRKCQSFDFEGGEEFNNRTPAVPLKRKKPESTLEEPPNVMSKKLRKTPSAAVNEKTLFDHIQQHCGIAKYSGYPFVLHDGVWYPAFGNTIGNILLTSLPEEMLAGFRVGQSDAVAHRIFVKYLREPDALRTPPPVVLFENGCFDILAFKPVVPQEDWFIPFRVTAKFKPKVHIATPAFDNYIMKMANYDEETIDLLMACLGYCIMPGVMLKKIIILGQARDTGKSLLEKFLRELIGSANTSSISPSNMENDFLLSGIVGSSINMVMELPSKKISSDAVKILKTLSGGDQMVLQRKGENSFEYRSYAKLIFGTNHPVSIAGRDPAFWNRLILVPCQRSVPVDEQDPDLLGKLLLEKDGIVAKLMAAARKLVLNDFIFPACKQSDLLKSQWWDPIPGLCNFLAEECVFSDEYRTWSKDLFSAYCEYCDLNDLEKPRTDQSFLVALKEAYPELRSDRWAERGVQGRGFTGIRLRKPRSQDTTNKPIFQVYQP